MLEILVIPNCYLASLIKFEEILKLKDLVKFLESWYNIDKYANKIF